MCKVYPLSYSISYLFTYLFHVAHSLCSYHLCVSLFYEVSY